MATSERSTAEDRNFEVVLETSADAIIIKDKRLGGQQLVVRFTGKNGELVVIPSGVTTLSTHAGSPAIIVRAKQGG